MADMTYATLETQIIETSENRSTEFANNIKYFIDRAERRLTREIDTIGLTKYATSTFSSGDAFLAKPPDAQVIKSLSFTSNGSRINLVQQTNEYLNDYWPVRTSTGIPRYYSNYGRTTVMVAPAPVSAFAVEMSYVGNPDPLTSAGASTPNTTNYYTDRTPNALFYACMEEACYFMKNPQAAGYWAGLYNREREDLINEARRQRRDDVQIAANPGGGEDNLIEGSR
tara:strand:+ start:175 stop:852 length:678 start_codon:yes stop_codon:yes gene_type:complete